MLDSDWLAIFFSKCTAKLVLVVFFTAVQFNMDTVYLTKLF